MYQNDVKFSTEGPFRFVGAVLDCQFSDWHNGRDKVRSNTFFAQQFFKMVCRWFVVNFNPLCEILHYQTNIARVRQGTVWQVAEIKINIIAATQQKNKNKLTILQHVVCAHLATWLTKSSDLFSQYLNRQKACCSFSSHLYFPSSELLAACK